MLLAGDLIGEVMQQRGGSVAIEINDALVGVRDGDLCAPTLSRASFSKAAVPSERKSWN